MDQIHGQLKDLIIFINQNSRFNIYGVELDYYKYENFEILIPKLFGAQVKKEVGTKKPALSIPSDEEYIKLYESVGLKDQIQQSISFYNELREGRIVIPGLRVAKTPKNIIAYFTFPNQEKVSFTLNLASINTKSEEDAYLDLWCYDKVNEQKVIEACKKYLRSIKLFGSIKGNYALIAKLPVKQFSSKDFQNFFIDLSQ